MFSLVKKYILLQKENMPAQRTDEMPAEESLEKFYSAKEIQNQTTMLRAKPVHTARKLIENKRNLNKMMKYERNKAVETNKKESTTVKKEIGKKMSDGRNRRRTINKLLKVLKEESIQVETVVDEKGRIFFIIEMTDIVREDKELNGIADMIKELMQESLMRFAEKIGKTRESIDEITRKLKRHLVVESQMMQSPRLKTPYTDGATQVSRPCCTLNKERDHTSHTEQKADPSLAATEKPAQEKHASQGNTVRETYYTGKSSEGSLLDENVKRVNNSKEKELKSLLYSYIASHLEGVDMKASKGDSYRKGRDISNRRGNLTKLHVQVPFFGQNNIFLKPEEMYKRKKELKKRLEKKDVIPKRFDTLPGELPRPKRPIVKFKKEKDHDNEEKPPKDVKRSLLRLKKQIERKLRRSKKYEEKKKMKDVERWNAASAARERHYKSSGRSRTICQNLTFQSVESFDYTPKERNTDIENKDPVNSISERIESLKRPATRRNRTPRVQHRMSSSESFETRFIFRRDVCHNQSMTHNKDQTLRTCEEDVSSQLLGMTDLEENSRSDMSVGRLKHSRGRPTINSEHGKRDSSAESDLDYRTRRRRSKNKRHSSGDLSPHNASSGRDSARRGSHMKTESLEKLIAVTFFGSGT